METKRSLLVDVHLVEKRSSEFDVSYDKRCSKREKKIKHN